MVVIQVILGSTIWMNVQIRIRIMHNFTIDNTYNYLIDLMVSHFCKKNSLTIFASGILCYIVCMVGWCILFYPHIFNVDSIFIETIYILHATFLTTSVLELTVQILIFIILLVYDLTYGILPHIIVVVKHDCIFPLFLLGTKSCFRLWKKPSIPKNYRINSKKFIE